MLTGEKKREITPKLGDFKKPKLLQGHLMLLIHVIIKKSKNDLASPSFKILVHRHLLPFHCVSIFLVSHPALSSNLSVLLIGCRSLSATHIKPEKTEHAVSS